MAPRSFDAARVYDRIGRLQDTQAFYERPAVDDLLAHLDLATSTRVLEIGCGTGRLAERLLRSELGGAATYLGTEVSAKMAALTRARLEPWSDRAAVEHVTGGSPLPAATGRPDRVIAAYVFDLLSDTAAVALLAAVRSVITPDAKLGLVTLAASADGLAGHVAKGWASVWRRAPGLVGGCRPVDLAPALEATGFAIDHRRTVSAWAVASDVIVAVPAGSERVSPGAGH